MLAFLARRLALAVVTLWGVVSIVFVVMRIVPGDPAALILGVSATPDAVVQLRHQLGLDRPIPVQYILFLKDAVRGDMGRSLFIHQSATKLVLEKIPATAELAVLATLLSVVISFPLGIASALSVNSVWDRIVSFFTLGAQSMPNYWVALMLILIFSRKLNFLPTSGAGSWPHLVMPVVTLAFPFVALATRLVRSGTLETLRDDYVRTARAKGLAQVLVLRRHVLKNMLIPVVTVLGLQLGTLLGAGAVIVETVFSWPGLGSLTLDALLRKDFPVVQAAILAIALAFVVVNLLVDVMYTWLNPRIRY
ncbi:MAG: ABC transporter permease [Chloroflexota bacterium]